MKRVLSLWLAMAMLLLALPVLSLPAGATEATLTANFYVPVSGGANGKGEAVKSGSFSTLEEALPTDADLSSTAYTASDILTWAYYSGGKYYDIRDYFTDNMSFPTESIDFYPIFVSSSHLENLPVLSQSTSVSSAAFVTYRGGWTYHTPYAGKTYGPFSKKSDIMQYSTWSPWLYGGVYFDGDVVVGGTATYATILRYQVMCDGEVTVEIPRIADAKTSAGAAVSSTFLYAVIKNGIKGTQILGNDTGTVGNLYDKANGWFSFGEGETEKRVTFAVKKGDTVDVAVHKGTTMFSGARTDFNPTITCIPADPDSLIPLNFYIGPTASNGQNTLGTQVSSTTAFDRELPTTAQLTAAGSSLVAEDILGWYTWNGEEEAFVSIEEYFDGVRTSDTALHFYPMTRSSALVGYYADCFTDTTATKPQNQPLFTWDADARTGELLSYTGGWSVGSYVGTHFTAFSAFLNTSSMLLGVENADQDSGAYYVDQGAVWGGSSASEMATAYIYHAPVSGRVEIVIPTDRHANVLTAVAKNGSFVWPTALEGTPVTGAHASGWQSVTYRAGDGDVWAEENRTATFEMNVSAGDKIAFLFASSGADGQTSTCHPRVEYLSVYDALPTVSAQVVVDGSLTLNTAVATPDGLVGVTESGLVVNGERIEGTEIPVDPKDADKKIVVQPYYVLEDGVTVLGKKSAVTLNGMLKEYAASDHEGIKAAAEATLHYTAAAHAYFDDTEKAPTYTAPVNRADYIAKSERIGVGDYTGEDEVRFRGISLLLNDRVNIKIVIRGKLPEDAILQIDEDPLFASPETVTGTATEDGVDTKFIMDGISAANWNTDYCIRVVDADKKAISDTLCYSVAAYYGRMIENGAATDKLKAVISSLMALHEAISAS